MMCGGVYVQIRFLPPFSLNLSCTSVLTATKPSGLLATFWNLPMFSPASTDPILGDKNTYKTLVRLGPPFNKLGLALVEVFRHFNWSRVVLVSRRKTDEKKVFCDYSSRSAEEQFRLADITVADKIQISDNLDVDTIDEILTRVQQRTRGEQLLRRFLS